MSCTRHKHYALGVTGAAPQKRAPPHHQTKGCLGRVLLPCCEVGFIKQRVPLGVYCHVVMWDSSDRAFHWACVLASCDVGFKQMVPVGAFSTMLCCGIAQTERLLGRVYCHVVMWDPSNRGFPWACLLPCCDVGVIKQKVSLGVFTTML